MLIVVSYRNSTSNHNSRRKALPPALLYLIEIPHQTTTQLYPTLVKERCILSKFHIKPQLYRAWASCILCCILSKFHIKPQHRLGICFADIVVSYRNSTSNHNTGGLASGIYGLYLIEIPHQTTTPARIPRFFCCCILSKFHIKPQRRGSGCLP